VIDLSFYVFNYKQGRVRSYLSGSPKLTKIIIILGIAVILIVPFIAKIIVLVQNRRVGKTPAGNQVKTLDMPKTEVCKEPNSPGQKDLLYQR
jgi:hypothetical protein